MAQAASYTGAWQAAPVWIAGPSLTPKGYQQITSLTAAQSLTVPAGATLALVSAETNTVRYRDDGVAPTATVGFPLAVGVTLAYSSALAAVQFIDTSTGAKLDVLYY